jgi:cytochrome c-type biogenesis protein CcmH
MLWIIFGVMLLSGVVLVALPIVRREKRLSLKSASAAILMCLVSVVLYDRIGSPGVDSDAGALPDINAMVESLDRRLRDNPDDVAGWKMLGRSYMQLENFDKAVNAFEQALERDGGGDGQTMSDLGEAILMQQHGAIAGRAAAMFESAIAATPNNSKALFYGGIAAVERGDRALAADRWEALLGLSPPPEVQNTLRQRIAEWRGEPLPAADSQDDAVPNKSLAISIALGAAAGDAVSPDATVFVIARDPARSPPARRR